MTAQSFMDGFSTAQRQRETAPAPARPTQPQTLTVDRWNAAAGRFEERELIWDGAQYAERK